MTKYIIAGRDGRPSTKGVFSQMTEGEMLHRRVLPSKTYWRHYKHGSENYQKVRTFNPESNDVIIRWGSRIEFDQTGFISYNNSKALKLASNKKLARLKMLEKGVRVPRVITPENYDEINPTKIIARPLQHSKGKNFVVLVGKQQFLNHYREGWYYSEFINKEREFRVHVVLGKVLACLEKPQGDSEAWNRAVNHEAFTLMEWGDVRKDISYQACLACEALNLDLGGVDVMWYEDKAYVIEVNTAPTLNSSPHVTTKYAKVFDFIFRNTNGEKLKPWDFRKWSTRKSFFWKDFQLEKTITNNDCNSCNDD